jgi:tetratricopeptide (TPR) repeat protein
MAKPTKSNKKGREAAAQQGTNFFSPIIFLPLLALVTWMVYSQCADFEVTNWDDNHYIREVLLIRSLAWSNIVLMFKTKVLLSYNPLVILSLAIDYALGDNSAGWYHGTNVLFHVINAVLVFVVFRKLLQKDGVAALLAALFALHPMHVESVAWIASRKDVLYTFFFLLSWWLYLLYVQAEAVKTKRWLYYGLSLLLFLCSGFSKIQAITLPLVLILSDYLRDRRFVVRKAVDKVPFLLGALAFGMYAVSSSTLAADKYAAPVSFGEKVVYSFQAFWLYVVKAVLPFYQSAVYAFPLPGTTDYFIALIGGIILTAVALFFVFRYALRYPWLVFGVLFFLVNIFPTLHIVGLNSSLIYERFSYVSYLGIFIFLIELPAILPAARKSLPVLLWLLLIPFAVLSYQRTSVWKNSLTLWSDVIEKNPRSHEAYNNRGAWFNEHGEIEKARADFDASLALNSRQPRTYNNRSMIWFRKKDYARSLQDIETALALEPKLAEAWCNRGNVYFDLQQYDTAVVYYSKAQELMPNFPSNLTNRGSAYLKLGDYENANADYEKATEQQPDYADAWRLGALAYARRGLHDKARVAAERANALNPRAQPLPQLSGEYYNMAFQAFEKKLPLDTAVFYLERSALFNPGNPDIWLNLAGIYRQQRQFEKAREYCRKALSIDPNNQQALAFLRQIPD